MPHSTPPRSWTLTAPRAAAALCAAAGLSLLVSCGNDGQDAEGESVPEVAVSAEGTNQAAPSEPAAEGTEQAYQTPTADALAPVSPEALDEDQKLEVLLNAGELPEAPESHSTHTGIPYFQDYIAVEYTQYQDTFGETPCAASMDRIIVDLVGEQPLSGLAHAYRMPEDVEEYSPQVYAWILSFSEQVDTNGIWDRVLEQCGGTQLEAGEESVEINRLELTEDLGLDVNGVTMLVHRQEEPLNAGAAVRHSMTVDYGQNLLMLAAVGLDEEDFSTVAEAQLSKLAEHRDSTEHDDA